MIVAVAHTEIVNSSEAAEYLINDCKQKLGEYSANAGLLFIAIDYEFQIFIDKVNDSFPNIQLIGCTTDGEMSSELSYCQDSATLIVFHDETIHFKAGLGIGLDTDVEMAVAKAIEAATVEEFGEPKLCITTPAGLVASSTVIIDTLRRKLGENFPIVGGVAGDDWQFVKTTQFCGREIVSNGIPVLLCYGDFNFSIGIASGWSPIGRKGVVTKSDDTTLQRIGDMTAVEFFRKSFGNYVPVSPEYPFLVHHECGGMSLRAPFQEQPNGDIVMKGHIPVGSVVELAHASIEEILTASNLSLNRALKLYPGKPDVALLFSCAARKQVLGSQTYREHKLLKDHLKDIPSCGFYTYGEFAPQDRSSYSDLHNETFVVLLMGSKK